MNAPCDKFSDAYAKFYKQSEHLSLDEIVLFKGIVIFKQYNPKKHKHFGIKICKLYALTGYTHNMRIYMGKDR
jgi:hypothetical protein